MKAKSIGGERVGVFINNSITLLNQYTIMDHVTYSSGQYWHVCLQPVFFGCQISHKCTK